MIFAFLLVWALNGAPAEVVHPWSAWFVGLLICAALDS